MSARNWPDLRVMPMTSCPFTSSAFCTADPSVPLAPNNTTYIWLLVCPRSCQEPIRKRSVVNARAVGISLVSPFQASILYRSHAAGRGPIGRDLRGGFEADRLLRTTFALGFLLLPPCRFMKILLPSADRFVQDIVIIELIVLGYRYGTATFEVFSGGRRGAALRPRRPEAARSSTRPLAPNSGFGKGTRFQIV